MSRSFRHYLLVGVGAAIALTSPPLLALADTSIQARGWTHAKYGRLVLDDAADLTTGASIRNHRLVIEFSEPVSVELRDALQKLATYVQGPPTAQGRTLELSLAQPVTLGQFVENNKLVLDFKPATFWPADQPVPVLGAVAQAETSDEIDDTRIELADEAASFETGAGTQAAETPKAEQPKIEPAPTGDKELAPIPNVTAEPARIVVRHGNHGTYVRLAIDWPGKIAYRISRDGDLVAVTFTAPANIDLGPARVDLPKELVQIEAVSDNVARIYLTLAPGASLRDFLLGRTVVLDIMRPAKQTASAPPLHLPAAPSPEASASQPQETRAAQPQKTPEAQPEKAAQAQPQKAPEPKAQTAPGAQPQKTAPAQPQKAPEKKPELKPVEAPSTIVAAPEPEPKAPATIAELPSEPQFALQSLPAMPEAAPEPAPAPKASEAAAEQAPAPKVSEAAQPALPPMPPVEQAAVPPRAPVNVSINVAPIEDGAKIIFTWPEAVSAAAFHHDGALWLAFDMPSSDVKALTDDARVAKLGKVTKLDVADSTIIRLAETQKLGVAMRLSGRSWIVDLTQGGRDGALNVIDQRRETLADGASSLLLRTNGPGRVAAVSEEGGGKLYVVPVRPAGLGIAEEASWPEFKVLPSYQGVVIAGLSDMITVDSLSQGVVVTTKPQGALTPVVEAPKPDAPASGEQVASKEQQPSEQPANAGQQPGAAKEGQPVLESVPGLFDLPSWRRGGEATFTADQRQLESAVSDADEETEKAAARMQLGEFYFAHGLIAEANDALSLIGREGRAQLDQRELMLLTGAIQTLDGELEKAHASLSDKSLDDVAEDNLFQGLLAAREQKWQDAATRLSAPLPSIADYPKPIREQIYILAGTALNEAGNPIAAQRFADALRQDQPDQDSKDRLTYLQGHIKLKAGERDEALALWSRLAESNLDDIRARSQFDLVEERLKGGELKPADAIAPLEALRFANRGGDFEFNLLRKLGTLYLDDNQPRKGLVTLRDAAAHFPERPEAKEIGEQMSKKFRELYLENGADRLTPLTAVALYDEFRELTPAGADGDHMISLLADRLVKVDLLGRAGELLDSLVKKRLTGLDKAQAGTRLAAIRMLDQKPELALQALKDSVIEEALPPELAAERTRLQARATFDSGNTLRGLQMLEGDHSLEAKWLRADMQWRIREWPAAAAALGDLIEGEEQAMADERSALQAQLDPAKNPAASINGAEAEQELADKQEQHFKERVAPMILNRAVALSLASDRRGLKALASEYGKQMEATEQAKAFAMLTAPDNGLVESVSAEMSSVDRIDAFVTDYRERLKKASLSAGASGS
jgi:hypothetical protein